MRCVTTKPVSSFHLLSTHELDLILTSNSVTSPIKKFISRMINPKKVTSHPESRVRLMRYRSVQYFLEFCDMTTLHGVRYLVEKNRCLLERLFWGLALGMAYYCCWFFVAQLVNSYNTSPVVMNVGTKVTPCASFPSPAVTVCTTTHISNAKIDFTTISKMDNLSEEMNARLNVIHNLCWDGKGDCELLDNKAVKYMLNHYIPDLERVVISVSRMNEEIKPLSQHVQTLITSNSVCFSHNLMPLASLFRPEYLEVYEYYGIYRKTPDPWTSWTPDLGYNTSETTSTPLRLWGDTVASSTKYILARTEEDHDPACSFGTRGISVFFHSPAEVTWRTHTNIFIDTMVKEYSFITPIVTSTDETVKVWSPQKRGCYFENERYLRYFRIYTKNNCERECDTNNTYDMCGCAQLSQPRNLSTPICGPMKTKCVGDSQRAQIEREVVSDFCNCLPACHELEYRFNFQRRPWVLKANTTMTSLLKSLNPKTTTPAQLVLMVRGGHILVTKRSALIDLAAYVANIGGVLSLFLGFSFLSLFEILYFLTLRVLINVWIWWKARPLQTHPSRPASLWAHRVPHEFNMGSFVN